MKNSYLKQMEARFDRWISLPPRMADDERKYLQAHAYCALSDVAQILQSGQVLASAACNGQPQTVANLQRRYAHGAIDFVDSSMSVHRFMAGATSAFNAWHAELAKRRPNRHRLVWVVQTQLFQGSDAAWHRYVEHVRKSAPWFDVPQRGDNDAFQPRGGRLAAVLRIFFQ